MMKLTKPRVIAVDVTALATLARTTGIQQVVRSVLGGSHEFSLVVFDSNVDGFRLVEDIPTIVDRDRSWAQRLVRRLVRDTGLIMWGLLSPLFWVFLGSRGHRFFKRLALRVFQGSLSSQRVSVDADGEKLELSEIDFLWILDIPKTDAHTKFLRKICSGGQVRYGIYVYDTIPLDFAGLIPKPSRDEETERFLEYFELIRWAERVYCLSKYSLGRTLEYAKKFHWKLSNSPSVLYPPLAQEFQANLRGAEVKKESIGGRLEVLAIAPLNRQKNLRVLFKALRKLLRKQFPIRLQVLAPIRSDYDLPTVFSALFTKLRYPRSLSISGPVSQEELLVFYRKAHVVAVPSLAEGYGLPIVEALSFGCSVHASKIGVFEELADYLPIELVKPQSADDWAETLGSFEMTDEDIDLNLQKVTNSPQDFRFALTNVGKVA